jgi:single-strand DNA-binding protein
MASRNPVCVSGNLAADPERFAAGERSGVRLLVVENIGYRGRDGAFVEESPVFWPVTVWHAALGANILASLRKGAHVTVVARYRNNVWEKDGEKRNRLELAADDVAASLRWASVEVTRNARPEASRSGDDVWAALGPVLAA